MAFLMAAADDVFCSDYFCVVFSHSMSWLGCWIELCQILRIFLIINVDPVDMVNDKLFILRS